MPAAEKALIEQIRRMAGLRRDFPRNLRGLGGRLRIGIGDDCAVLRIPDGHETLVTTDFSLEGIHFRRDWQTAESIGHRCVTRGLSDIAAMGGEPVAAFLSLALPKDVSQGWVQDFVSGLAKLAGKFGVVLAGGDTAESPGGILADIIVVGSAPKGTAVLRSGAKPGDGIYVSGTLGGSAAAVDRMIEQPKRRLNPHTYHGHFRPQPRIKLGGVLRKKSLASAMIDISDGLSTDLAHLCEESGVSAQIEEELIPRAKTGRPPETVALKFALHGGEDYELLFTAPGNVRLPAKIAGVPITRIGRVMRGRKMILASRQGSEELKPRGWEHFRSPRN